MIRLSTSIYDCAQIDLLIARKFTKNQKSHKKHKNDDAQSGGNLSFQRELKFYWSERIKIPQPQHTLNH